ncbi:Galactosylgalactosylxylosylprotein 3-beta-glucuronosyltransferase [Seminavis robusta]|uniref:Galactosylgalactosylxylosylprotein 3-beta-glucuronosyltransferase n=1 Tax=Seminavis robusta TaxID=568900 RepID=A0A9N8EGT4_9STRA|nr:Galactosylgalactosylxylosylprotein 3-beta-glucuronosyltransferase [Seminavis robusta]|eukprot:Sro1074_g238310.1 Galactosylgalactosylxylosylprotein 3-beta-glucuronosyltransferase (395) ;mRNA; f:21369-22553
MKTTVFFIMVALLVLGYLHLLTMYAQRIDSSVIFHHVAARNSIQEEFKQSHQSQQYQSGPPLSDSRSVQLPPPRLSAAETKQLQELTAFSSQELPPLVQRIPDHQGRSIPKDKATLLQQLADLDDPQIRAQRVLYIITPTHKRITQRVDLMRLQQTLTLASLQYHHSLIYWIILEDAPTCSHAVRNIAQESGLYFAHKAVHSSDNNNKKKKKKTPHRGLAQRNAGLETVLQVGKEGVIYFADDDNGYDSRLFAELLFTRHTSIFAVGLSGGAAYERCHVDPTTGKVDAILSTWKPKYNVGKRTRKFPMDMAGFALSTTALVTTKARFRPQSTAGMLETDFLSLLVADVAELEPLAANCTRILAWHVKTTEPQWAHNPELDGDGTKTFALIKSML